MTLLRTLLIRGVLTLAVLAAVATLPADRAQAHPHVFVDGGADFVIDETGALKGIRVVWRYDAFATLFTLASLEVDQDGDGALTEEERAVVLKDQTDWPEDFEGDSYLWIDGAMQALGDPVEAGIEIVEGRLTVTFERHLTEPAAMRGREAEVKLYDPVYYFAYFTTDPPKGEGLPGSCSTRVVHFEPDKQLAALQTTLFALGQEETPEIENVGALFADRIILQCD